MRRWMREPNGQIVTLTSIEIAIPQTMVRWIENQTGMTEYLAVRWLREQLRTIGETVFRHYTVAVIEDSVQFITSADADLLLERDPNAEVFQEFR